MIKDRPRRLDRVYPSEPLYFVTFCTRNRRPFPSFEQTQSALEVYAKRGLREFNVAVGHYVIMPDHIHLFVRGDTNFVLSRWIAGLKRAISDALKISGVFWQPTFFDHILRNDESYSQKWLYVCDNPVRASLVNACDDWPFKGEIVVIDRA
jgi:putative transposase